MKHLSGQFAGRQRKCCARDQTAHSPDARSHRAVLCTIKGPFELGSAISSHCNGDGCCLANIKSISQLWTVNCTYRIDRLLEVKTVLIVDRDLGFVFWLGQILDAAGYVAGPARGVTEAAKIVAMLRLPVDVLVAPQAERGFHAFVEKLRFASPDLKVVALAGEGDSTLIRRPSDAVWKRKPCRRDEAAKSEWLGLIHDLDRSYTDAHE